MKKAKKKRKDEKEQDSDSKSDREGILASHLRRTLASNRRHMLQNPRRGSGGGGSSPERYFIHHNFRYGPEPPAYKTPKPDYPSYPRREPERPPVHDRHVVERSIDEKIFERFMRKFWKDIAEDEFLEQDASELDVDTSDRPAVQHIALKDIEKLAEIPKKYSSKIEFEPLLAYTEKKKQEPKEAEYDPEQLLKGLEAYPTEELQDKTLAELNSEPKFNEEEMDGSRVETGKLSSPRMAIEQTQDQYVSSEESIEAKQSEASAELEPQNIETAENTAAVENPEAVDQSLVEVQPVISEVELLTDVQDLMRELEPEIEEQEEVEPSY